MLHVSPYCTEDESIANLHAATAIAEAEDQLQGRHRELPRGPRRRAPEHLRRILRQPIEAAMQAGRGPHRVAPFEVPRASLGRLR